MKLKKPSVTVLMPFYDDGREFTRKYFAEAVRSILGQEFKEHELVIVVSGKGEYTKKMARGKKNVRVFFCSNEGGYDQGIKRKVRGLARARNLGIRMARGEFVAFADADDLSEPMRLEKQLRFLKAHPEIGVVGSSMKIIDENGNLKGARDAYENDSEIRRGLMQFNPIPQPTVMLRRKLVIDAGGYSENEIAEDYDLWVKLAKITKFYNLQVPLVRYRVHPGSGATRVSMPLYFGSLGVKWRAATTLGMTPGLKDIAVNLFQFASLFFPQGIRRTVLEKMRGKLVIGR